MKRAKGNSRPSFSRMIELLEQRQLLSAAASHVLILSVDGLHQADLTDPQLQADLTNINALRSAGITYANANTTSPSDSFPATASYLTGANPGTAGVFYDNSYSRTLLPSVDQGGGSTPGTPTSNDDSIDINGSLLNGGGNSDATSIDPNKLARSPFTGQPVEPNGYLAVNTIYDVASQAGMYTALIEKHPSYETATGTNPSSINDFYAPEIAATVALYDPTTHQTVNADALLASAPFTDVSKYTLVDASTDPLGANDPNLVESADGNTLLTEAYDNLKVQAILNEINGQASHASPSITNPQVPNLFDINFQAIVTAEESFGGGIAKLANGKEGAPSAMLEAAIKNTDTNIGEIVAALKTANLWSGTEVYMTAKQGQNPRLGAAGLTSDSSFLNVLSQANVPVAFEIPDDLSLIYLQNQSQTKTAVKALKHFRNTATLDVYYNGVLTMVKANKVFGKILSGAALVKAGLGNPATDATTPDIIITVKDGYTIEGGDASMANGNADHGGFVTDDTHVPLIVSGGALGLKGPKLNNRKVELQQIAVSALQALGLDPDLLSGVDIDHTQPLPGLSRPSFSRMIELLEQRQLLSAAASHVLILSVDGLHQADLTDPQLQADLTNINALRSAGITYANANTTSPSDSFPATASYLTGANPGTAGVFYDNSYSRTLLPSVDQGGGSTPGTPTSNDDSIDINGSLLNGGGNSDATSIDPNKLARSPFTGQPVEPNGYLAVNTIYDVASQAGMYTALIEKHPSYETATGTNPSSINDFYAPEIAATVALYDPTTHQTVNADALLASAPFTDVSKYTLVDASTDPLGANDPNLVESADGNTLLTEAYDNLKVQAILNEINGQASHASPSITDPQVPNLFDINFQAIVTAEESFGGGIAKLANGKEGAPSAMLEAAIKNTDTNIGEIVAALKTANLWSGTEVYMTAKQGQNPRLGAAGLTSDSSFLNVLSQANVPVAFEIPDDLSLIYLQNQSQTKTAVKALKHFRNTATLDVYYNGVLTMVKANKVFGKILSGAALVKAGLGNPATDATTPDIIMTVKDGYTIEGGDASMANGNADHGGFVTDDTHVPLIVSGGALGLKGPKLNNRKVELQQIAVSALQALGLDPDLLSGVDIDHTQPLPGLG